MGHKNVYQGWNCSGWFWGIYMFPKTNLGLVNWHNMPIYSNKTIKLYGKYSNKAVMIVYHTHLYVYFSFFIPEMGLEEGQSNPDLCIPPYSENPNLCTNCIVKCNVCASTWSILYLMVGSTHHTSNPVIYIPLVSLT